MAAYHVVWECVVEQWLGVRRMLSNKRHTLRVDKATTVQSEEQPIYRLDNRRNPCREKGCLTTSKLPDHPGVHSTFC